jgi:hypothetical protein
MMFRRRPKTVADNPVFEKLMLLGRNDREVRDTLKGILRLPPLARRAELVVLLGKMQVRGAPADLEEAIAYLLNDGVAETALTFMGGETTRRKGGPDCKRPSP